MDIKAIAAKSQAANAKFDNVVKKHGQVSADKFEKVAGKPGYIGGNGNSLFSTSELFTTLDLLFSTTN